MFGWLPPYDDAYITLTSAQALWTGSIHNYPGTPALYGITSPAHVLLIAALLPFTSPLTALWLSQVISAFLYAVGLWALARAWSLTIWQAGAFILIGLTVGMVPHQLFNGLETGLALAGVTWSLALIASDAPIALGLLGVLPFIRPELGLLSLALVTWRIWRTPSTWGPTMGWAALGALPFALIMRAQLGTIIPTSASTKAAFLSDSCLPLSMKAMIAVVSVTTFGFAIGPAMIGVVGAWRSALARLSVAVCLVVLVAYALGLPTQILRYHAQRYLYAWVPLVLVCGLAALPSRRGIRTAVLALVALVTLLRVPAMYAEHRAWTDPFLTEQAALHTWLRWHISPDARLMVIDAGYLAYALPYPLVDAVGLKSPMSAVRHLEITGPSCGRARGAALAAIARDTGATYFVSWGEWDRTLGLPEALRAEGFHVGLLREKPPNVVGDVWYPVYHIWYENGRP